MNYREGKQIYDKIDGNLVCLCGEKDGWTMKERMDDPGDCMPVGSGDFYLRCVCGISVPFAIAEKAFNSSKDNEETKNTGEAPTDNAAHDAILLELKSGLSNDMQKKDGTIYFASNISLELYNHIMNAKQHHA